MRIICPIKRVPDTPAAKRVNPDGTLDRESVEAVLNILAARSKPVTARSPSDLGVDPAAVGLAGSWTQVLEVTPRPPRQAGRTVTDDGSGAVGARALADFLAERKLIATTSGRAT